MRPSPLRKARPGNLVLKLLKVTLNVIYRLTVPGGLLLFLAALLIRAGILGDPATTPYLIYFPYAIFGTALVLSAVFNRSRLFFVLFTLILAEGILLWMGPIASGGIRYQIIFDSVAFLLPVNLTITAAMRDRGIVSPSGRRRLAWIAGQALVILVLAW